jgi:glycerol-3-phosphate dehydrogenase
LEIPVERDDIVASFSGVRPLYNDGAGTASAATRDYVLRLDDEGGLPLLNIFGGKITTYRKLAESVMTEIRPFFGSMSGSWTATAPLPGGDFAVDGFEQLVFEAETKYPFMPDGAARRLVRAYGTDVWIILKEIDTADDLGTDFGAGVFAAELDWVVKNEWVSSAEDFVWRRTRLGLRLSAQQIAAIDNYVSQRHAAMTC